MMSEAGCCGIFYGIESGSQRMQKIINKNIKVKEVVKSVRMTKANGIQPFCAFIFGFPEENVVDILKTIALVFKLSFFGIYRFIPTEFTFVPGSDYTEKYEEKLRYKKASKLFSFNRGEKLSETENTWVTHFPGIFTNYFTIKTSFMKKAAVKFAIVSVIHFMVFGRFMRRIRRVLDFL